MRRRWLMMIFWLVAASVLLTVTVSANSAEPPGLTVIVTNPPEDLSLYIQFPDKSQKDPISIQLRKERKGWEAYYRFFYYNQGYDRLDSLKDTTMVVQGGGEEFQCPIPADSFRRYNNLLTLSLKTQSLSVGQSPLRIPMLVTMRVLLTLLLEGLVFYLWGYRERRSWTVFLVVNLITQGGLNMTLTGPGNASYWQFAYILGEGLVFLAEMGSFSFFLKEKSKGRAVACAALANSASLIVGGMLLTYLPM